MKIAMLGVKAIPCPGGICTYTEQIGSRLVARGHEVVVYCRRQYLPDDETSPISPHRGVRRRLSPGLRGKYFDAVTHTLSSALDALVRDFDVVHVHGSAPAVVAPLLRLRRGRPVVVTIHSLDWTGAKWGSLATAAMRAAARVPIAFAHEMTVVSRQLRDFYQRTFGRETTYIPSGVEIPELLPANEIHERWGLEPGEYLLFVGRLTPEKGLEYLLSAYNAIDTDKKLVIVGGTNFRDPYVERLRQQAGPNVVFTGYQHGSVLAELFSNAYLYVQPSTLEALSMAVLEALSYGRCVLASDIPGNLEALGDGQCGRTFMSADADDLRRVLAELLACPYVVADQFGVARRYVAREYDWEKTTDGFEAVYERAVSEAGSRSEHQTACVAG
ncbi:MAG: glycosyltransferase family 4 protein [Armatimonadota bacterium]